MNNLRSCLQIPVEAAGEYAKGGNRGPQMGESEKNIKKVSITSGSFYKNLLYCIQFGSIYMAVPGRACLSAAPRRARL